MFQGHFIKDFVWTSQQQACEVCIVTVLWMRAPRLRRGRQSVCGFMAGSWWRRSASPAVSWLGAGREEAQALGQPIARSLAFTVHCLSYTTLQEHEHQLEGWDGSALAAQISEADKRWPCSSAEQPEVGGASHMLWKAETWSQESGQERTQQIPVEY